MVEFRPRNRLTCQARAEFQTLAAGAGAVVAAAGLVWAPDWVTQTASAARGRRPKAASAERQPPAWASGTAAVEASAAATPIASA
ncbi:hypothetical protein D3C78_1519210 [compost metagenome]